MIGELEEIFDNTDLDCLDHGFIVVAFQPIGFITLFELIFVNINYNLTWRCLFVFTNSYFVEDFMPQQFFRCWSKVWIEFKHLLQDFNQLWGSLGEPFSDGLLFLRNTHHILHVVYFLIIS